MIKSIVAIMLGLSLFACSSSTERKLEEKDNSDTIERDYKVKDSSSRYRPGWIEDPQLWAKQKELDVKSYRYYAVETVPKVDRNIACQLAKTQTRSEIAAEIATYIENTLTSYREGGSSIDLNAPEATALKEFVENTLAERTSRMLYGAQIFKKYWERRRYLENLGAPKNFNAFTCAVFIRIKRDFLEGLIRKAANEVASKTEGQELKKKVEKALSRVDKDYNNQQI